MIKDVPPETKPVDAATSVENDDYDIDGWNPKNKNGVRFFDPFDWSKVQLDEATGEVKEADLDKVVEDWEAFYD